MLGQVRGEQVVLPAVSLLVYRLPEPERQRQTLLSAQWTVGAEKRQTRQAHQQLLHGLHGLHRVQRHRALPEAFAHCEAHWQNWIHLVALLAYCCNHFVDQSQVIDSNLFTSGLCKKKSWHVKPELENLDLIKKN